MTKPDFLAATGGPVLTMRIIWLAMLAGTIAFALIVTLILAGQPVAKPVISYVAIGFSVLAILASNIVPQVVGNHLATQVLVDADLTPPAEQLVGRLAAVYLQKLIIGLAILEGAAFLTLVAYHLERQSVALSASGALIFLLALRMPMQSRVADWCRRQYENAAMNDL